MKRFFGMKILPMLCIVLAISACEPVPVTPAASSNSIAPTSASHLHTRATPITPFDQQMYDMADFAWGGRLYDKWWALADGTLDIAPPETANTHPLWPATNTSKAGETTWRCKSCHGWDYRGSNGVYGSPGSSYLTGIVGIIPITDVITPQLTTPEEIYTFLHDGLVNNVDHGLGTILTDEMAFYALTKFVVTMQEEALAQRSPADFIDDATKLTTGVEADGAAIWDLVVTEGGCTTCHGADGKLIDFVDGDLTTMPNQFVDTYARGNPWEVLHKIRFGQPGSTPIMQGLEQFANFTGMDIIQASIDVVAFAQNGLVATATEFDYRVFQGGGIVEQAGLDLARGGILYDKWWTAIDETAPLVVPPDIVGVDHALWTPVATNLTPAAGDTTWRCKSCHGWDYVGVDGAYGIAGSSYETGIKGFVLSNGMHPNLMEPVAIFDFLHSGTVVEPNDHAFSAMIPVEDLYALTRFVVNAQTEAMAAQAPADLIDLATKAVPGGDPANGMAQYDLAIDAGGCGDVCHGADGTLIDFAPDGDPLVEPNIFVSDYAQGNPWETLHKIRFGHPGSIMPGLVDYQDPTLGLQQAADILSYTVAGFVVPQFYSGVNFYNGVIAMPAGLR
jgi:mono/diheme cytochrome c family protein